jgi:hypothetical protein
LPESKSEENIILRAIRCISIVSSLLEHTQSLL